MGLISKYLQYLSIVLFGFFVLTYSSIIQAGTNKLSMEDVVADVSEIIGQTITVSGYMLYPTGNGTVYLDSYVLYAHKPPTLLGLIVSSVKLNKKQKKWILNNCEWETMLNFDGGCYVNLTGVVDYESDAETVIIEAIEIKKMGLKDKLINIAIGEKNKLEGTVDFFKDIYE